jgi:hypothetical protein
MTGGGHLWVSLNWALGLRAAGCEVIWLEMVPPELLAPENAEMLREAVAGRRRTLAPYQLSDSLALCSSVGAPLPDAAAGDSFPFEAALDADLLLVLDYFAPSELVNRFRRTALLDIDPGLLQLWVSAGDIALARYDRYFTIGETVGTSRACFPDLGLRWHYTPPCVALDAWPTTPAKDGAPFTTVTHWWAGEWVGRGADTYDNTKRAGYLPFLELPRHTSQKLELALNLGEDEAAEKGRLVERGWQLRNAYEVSSTPWDYQHYVQTSRGEFGCAKPSCLRLQNAWLSDRTVCYLASGKPAVVQHTGASAFLPESEGLFRFRDMAEAVRGLERIALDYYTQSRCARALAEEHFDARKVVPRLLERALS